LHNYHHTWGEGASVFSDLQIFIFDLDSGKLLRASKIDEKIKITSAQFADKSGNSIVFCGITDTGEGLSGISGCMNKPSQIYLVEGIKKVCFSYEEVAGPGVEEHKKKLKLSEHQE
jgi:hypothetical protein